MMKVAIFENTTVVVVVVVIYCRSPEAPTSSVAVVAVSRTETSSSALAAVFGQSSVEWRHQRSTAAWRVSVKAVAPI